MNGSKLLLILAVLAFVISGVLLLTNTWELKDSLTLSMFGLGAFAASGLVP